MTRRPKRNGGRNLSARATTELPMQSFNKGDHKGRPYVNIFRPLHIRKFYTSARHFAHLHIRTFTHLHIIFTSAHSPIRISFSHPHICTSAHHSPHFTPKIANLLCMHKKRTEYRFELWYKL
jgi:hypothetical protein